ncbi:MAG: glycosyltransferase involved in cell wall biosynthesis [Candidatus Azotimanducaceae bacterium]|jgi:glycosyltransferase involved in cell wall biosynthesis
MSANTDKVNLLIVISNLGHGGAERQVVELCNRLDRDKFNIHLCTLSDHIPLASSLQSDVTLHTIIKRRKLDISVIWRLITLIRREDIRVVHSFLLDAEIATRIAGRLVKDTIVIGSERNSKHTYSRSMSLALSATSRLSHAIVANSNAGKAYHQATFGLDETKYHVVYNGVDTTRFYPGASNLTREEFDLPATGFIIGMVGSFKPQKNHAYLLETIELMTQSRKDFCVLLVGATVQEGDAASESYHADIMADIKRRNLEPYIRLTGARLDIDHVYRLCDATVLPSLFEGTPNVALESLACGVPVIATNVSDNAKVIPDGKVGMIVELDQPKAFSERVLDLIANPALREDMSKQAAAWIIDEFSTDKMAGNMTQVYDTYLTQKA